MQPDPTPPPSAARTWAGPVLLAIVAVGTLVLVRSSHEQARREEREIAAIAEQAAKFSEGLRKIRHDTRALLDPLAELLALDEALRKAGLRPVSGEEFSKRLATANQRLLEAGADDAIDPCAQRREVEKHWLYEGKKAPALELPGWHLPCPPATKP